MNIKHTGGLTFSVDATQVIASLQEAMMAMRALAEAIKKLPPPRYYHARRRWHRIIEGQ